MTRGMVLCAGLGTRLRPLTQRWPKPAMPLLAGPLVRYSFATLRRAGVTELGINTHHLPKVMEETARAEAGGPLEVSHESEKIQGTGGGIRGLKKFLSGDDFVVLNGDVLFALDLKPVIDAHRASRADATMVLLPMPAGEKYNPVEIDAASSVRRIAGVGPGGEKLSGWHFTGVHVMTPKVFDFMSPSGPEDINRDVYVKMIERGLTVRGHVLNDNPYWSDLGTPLRYLTTHEHLLFGQVAQDVFAEQGPLSGHVRLDAPLNGWKHPTARVHDDVKFAGPAFFGAGCVVEAGVRLGAAVSIGSHATVGQGARLNRVAVLPGAAVKSGASLSDVIVSADHIVPRE